MQDLKNIYHFFMALLAVALYGYPAKQLTVIGVTGTDGKTTTASMIYHILLHAGKKPGLVSTVGAKIGDRTYDIGLHVTTPSPFTLQKLLRQMVKERCDYAVIEATSHGLDQNRLVGCNFQYGVLTNITHEHLDYHKNYQRYAEAKAKLFRSTKVAVLNADGPWFEAVKVTGVAGMIISAGLNNQAQVNPKSLPVSLKLTGDHNLANAMAAAAVCQAIGVDEREIKEALASFDGIEGRLDAVDMGQPFTVIVDFAHTPFATEQVLRTLKNETEGRLIAMFGCAGLRDQTKRPITGEVVSRFADIAIVTADDPATEDVNAIIAQIVPGSEHAGAKEVTNEKLRQLPRDLEQRVYVIEPDRKKAIVLAISTAREGDTVALLSKGHQKSFSLGKQEIPWNEKELAAQVLKDLDYGQ